MFKHLSRWLALILVFQLAFSFNFIPTTHAADFGDGSDWALAPSGTFNLNTNGSGSRSYPDGVAHKVEANPTTTSINVGFTPNGFANGDKALLINLQGTSGDNSDVGNYEILDVVGTSGTSITLASAPTKSYDGSSFSNQKVVIQRIPQYSNVTLDGTDIITLGSTPCSINSPKICGNIYFPLLSTLVIRSLVVSTKLL